MRSWSSTIAKTSAQAIKTEHIQVALWRDMRHGGDAQELCAAHGTTACPLKQQSFQKQDCDRFPWGHCYGGRQCQQLFIICRPPLIAGDCSGISQQGRPFRQHQMSTLLEWRPLQLTLQMCSCKPLAAITLSSPSAGQRYLSWGQSPPCLSQMHNTRQGPAQTACQRHIKSLTSANKVSDPPLIICTVCHILAGQEAEKLHDLFQIVYTDVTSPFNPSHHMLTSGCMPETA